MHLSFTQLFLREDKYKSRRNGSYGTSFRASFEMLERREMMSANQIVTAPTLTANVISGSQVNLAWKSVAGATSYLVDEWVNGAWKQIGSFASNTVGCAVTGLTAGETYYFDVSARNSSSTARANFVTTVTIDHPIASSVYTAVAGSLFGSSGPLFTDVHQGAASDCWLLASLAEVAARNSSYIRNMFSYVGTQVENGVTVGLYSVRFFDTNNVARYVTVDTELPAGGATYDHPTNGVLWVALAEKAYAQANGKGYVPTGHGRSDSYTTLDFGDPTWALHAITGRSISSIAINPTNIAAAWNSGKFIVLASKASPNSSLIVSNHAYAVVGYNASSNMPFEEFNPWGTDSTGYVPNNHSKYGLFWANASFLSNNFTSSYSRAGGALETETFGSGVIQVMAGDSAARHAILNHAVPALTLATEEVANESRKTVFDSWDNSHELDHTDTLEMNAPSTSAWEVAFNSLSEELFSQVA